MADMQDFEREHRALLLILTYAMDQPLPAVFDYRFGAEQTGQNTDPRFNLLYWVSPARSRHGSTGMFNEKDPRDFPLVRQSALGEAVHAA